MGLRKKNAGHFKKLNVSHCQFISCLMHSRYKEIEIVKDS